MADQMIRKSHELGLTHAQRNGVEKVVQSLLSDAITALKRVVELPAQDQPDLDYIPF